MFNRKDEELTPRDLKLMQIERLGFHLAYWSLLLSMYIQIALGSGGWEMIIGEGVIFLLLTAYLCIRCVLGGIWNRHFQPGLKTNLVVSAAAGLLLGGFWFAISFRNDGNLQSAIGAGVFMALMLAIAVFVVLTILAGLMKKNENN